MSFYHISVSLLQCLPGENTRIASAIEWYHDGASPSLARVANKSLEPYIPW